MYYWINILSIYHCAHIVNEYVSLFRKFLRCPMRFPLHEVMFFDADDAVSPVSIYVGCSVFLYGYCIMDSNPCCRCYLVSNLTQLRLLIILIFHPKVFATSWTQTLTVEDALSWTLDRWNPIVDYLGLSYKSICYLLDSNLYFRC